MTNQIVAHTEDHETIDCPNCGIALCTLYPADWDTGEACETTYYATGVIHDCRRQESGSQAWPARDKPWVIERRTSR